MALRYGTKTLLFAMCATVMGVMAYRLASNTFKNSSEHLLALAAGIVIALGVSFIARVAQSFGSKVALISVVCLIGIWFARTFLSYVFGLMVGLLLPLITLPLLNFICRVAGVEVTRAKRPK